VYGLVLGGTVEYLVGMGPDQDVQDLHNLVAAQKTEHYEIAAYGNLAVIADRLGEGEIGDLLHETLEEESRARQGRHAHRGVRRAAGDGRCQRRLKQATRRPP
jgi:ferritin-like metal-binding protein YciE